MRHGFASICPLSSVCGGREVREGCEGAEVCEVGPIRRGPPDTKVLNEPSRYKVFIKSDSR